MSEGNDLRRTAGPTWLERIAAHFPPGQFGRYVAVGVGNTVFAYSTYAGLTALLTPHMPFAYLVAGAISSFLNITFSFLNYKFFVFRTKGNYLREWLRCVTVYGGSALIGTVLLAPLVFVIRAATGIERTAPYIAGGLLACMSVILGFVGHRNFSFAPSEQGKEAS